MPAATPRRTIAAGTVRSVVIALVVAFGAGLVVATGVLWPPAHVDVPAAASLKEVGVRVNGTVTTVAQTPCQGTTATPGRACQQALVAVRGSGLSDRALLSQSVAAGQPPLHVGDRVVLGRVVDPSSGTAVYFFIDFQRRAPLLLLAAVFAVVVVVLGGWRGATAVIGLGVSGLVLVRFVLAGILAGESPTAVAIVGAGLIIFIVIYPAHGISLRTTVALMGTLFSLGLTALLAVAFVHAAHLTGISSEESGYLQATASQVNLQGLLLASVVIGSLGVLNDVTVTQASATWELHDADRAAGTAQLYRASIRIGRDHIASTVYTLVLAYAGAALPLLLLFDLSGQHVGNLLTSELVAEEVVRTLAGAIGLVASVPITTALAAFLCRSTDEAGERTRR